MKYSKYLLILGGFLCFGFAVFQIAIGIVPEWSAYWGAGDELASNQALLFGTSLAVALLCVVAGLYALSGAGLLRRLPLLRTGLLIIGIICTLRGFSFILILLTVIGVLPSTGPILPTAWQSSFVFLLMGLSYLFGLAYGWRSLSQHAPKADSLAAAR